MRSLGSPKPATVAVPRKYDAMESDPAAPNVSTLDSSAKPAISSADEHFHAATQNLWRKEFEVWKLKFEN